MKTRFMISGSSGFLGKIVFNYLDREHACSRLVQKNGNRIEITNPFFLDPELDIETFVHVAGKAHSDPHTEGEIQQFYNVNLEGTKNLCRALEGLSVMPKSFVFISTVAVYGVDKGESIDENHPLNGSTPYAKSKILTENWLAEWAVENNVRLGVLRLPLIAGPNPPGNLSAMINGIKSGKYLSIGEANVRKSIVWAEDVASIIPCLADKGGIYNLTDGHHPTFGELEESISLALGKKRPISVPYWMAKGLAFVGDILGSRFPINSDKLRKITSLLTFDDQKARQELGWNPTFVVKMIKETVQ